MYYHYPLISITMYIINSIYVQLYYASYAYGSYNNLQVMYSIKLKEESKGVSPSIREELEWSVFAGSQPRARLRRAGRGRGIFPWQTYVL